MRKKSDLEIARERVQAELPGKTLLRVNYAALRKNDVAHADDATFFLKAGWYRDQPFRCVDCGKVEIWKDTQQKWWYEVAKGSVLTRATRCRACRNAHREKRAEHAARTMAGYERKMKTRANALTGRS